LLANEFSAYFREPGEEYMCLQRSISEKSKKSIKTMGCKAREPH
jgi:hypothetical protein